MKQTLPVDVLPVFDWDEPEGCTTPRGWLGLLNHPDLAQLERVDGSKCVGNYLDYTGTGEPGKDGKLIHACAYFMGWDHQTLMQHTVRLGTKWCADAAEAKRWVEEQVREYLETRA